MPITYEVEDFTLVVATAGSGPIASLMLELSHSQSDRIATAQIAAKLDGPTYDHTPAEPCDHCCKDCANRAAAARART